MDKPETQNSGGVVQGAEKWFSDAYHSVAGVVKAHPGETALGTLGTAAVVAGVVLAPEVTLPVLAIGGGALALSGCTAQVSTGADVVPVPAPQPDVCSAGPPADSIFIDYSTSSRDYPFTALPGDRIEVGNGGWVDTAPGSVTWVDNSGTAINDGGTICAQPGGLVLESATPGNAGLVIESAKVTPQAASSDSAAPAAKPAPADQPEAK